ncbi:MAG: lipopolysaccharide biosynthesis protein [Thermodesulfobacteriota bacterium]
MQHSPNLFLRLKESIFIRNILIVMSGTAVAQVIGLALTPIVSRLFTPEHFGISGAFESLAGIISAGVTLQYSQAIMLPKEKKEAFQLFFVSILSTLLVTLLLMTACLIIPSYLNGWMKTEGYWALALLVSVTFVSGLGQSFQAWSVRVKAFKHTSASQVIRSISSHVMRIGFGLSKGGAVGLIISSFIAEILATVNLMRVFIRDFRSFEGGICRKNLKRLAWEYRDFPLYSASQNVINTLSSRLPILLLTYYFGIAVAGAYAFAMHILTTPTGFILNALRQVLFQKAAETFQQEEKLYPLFFKITGGLFLLTFIPGVFIFFWAPQLFAFIFGAQWRQAGEFSRSLLIWIVFIIPNLPAVLFARIIRIQRSVFFYDLGLLAARVVSLTVGGLYMNAHQTIMLFALVGAVMNAFLILMVGYAIIQREGNKDVIGR